jgi:hypothetical protein
MSAAISGIFACCHAAFDRSAASCYGRRMGPRVGSEGRRWVFRQAQVGGRPGEE